MGCRRSARALALAAMAARAPVLRGPVFGLPHVGSLPIRAAHVDLSDPNTLLDYSKYAATRRRCELERSHFRVTLQKSVAPPPARFDDTRAWLQDVVPSGHEDAVLKVSLRRGAEGAFPCS